MSLRKFLSNSTDRIRRDGREGVDETVHNVYRIFWDRVSRVYGPGVEVYDREWDVLIILDACRADLFAEVVEGAPHLGSVETVRSAASCSEEWLEKTFTPERRVAMAATTYVTGNPFTGSYLDPGDFCTLDEVWRYGWDDSLGTVPAEPITDRAIEHWRAGECDRMIVHYMQPHFPSVPRPDLGSAIELDRIGEQWDSVWDQLRKGTLSEELIREAYRENLLYVLESVDLLLSSIDAERVVITADHANSFGSWGLYGHPRAPIAAIREVPWCETVAADVGGYVPRTTVGANDDVDDEHVETMLKNLGYL